MARQIPPFLGGESAYFLSVNRNKCSILLALDTAEGRALFLELVRHADVVLDNFRPGVMARLGMEYEQLAAVNPRIITCSISAFGQDGPYRERPAFDLVVQAMSGLMSITGEPDRPPVRMGLPMSDLGGGIFAVLGIMALLRRAQTGQGQLVDVALLDGLVGMYTYLAGTYFATGEELTPVGSAHHNIVPYQAFSTADGYVVVATFSDAFWLKLCAALERPDLTANPRFRTNAGRAEYRDVLVPPLEGETSTKSAALPDTEYLSQVLEIQDPHAVPQLTANNTFFEGFTAGDIIIHGNGRTVTDEHIARSYRLGNTHPLHFDRLYSSARRADER